MISREFSWDPIELVDKILVQYSNLKLFSICYSHFILLKSANLLFSLNMMSCTWLHCFSSQIMAFWCSSSYIWSPFVFWFIWMKHRWVLFFLLKEATENFVVWENMSSLPMWYKQSLNLKFFHIWHNYPVFQIIICLAPHFLSAQQFKIRKKHSLKKVLIQNWNCSFMIKYTVYLKKRAIISRKAKENNLMIE